MISDSSFFGFKSYGRITQSANTKITRLIEPSNGFTTVTYLEAIVGSTAHILTVMRPLGKTTVATAIAVSTTAWIMAANPGTYTGWQGAASNTPSSSDWMALQLDDGTILLDTVSSLSTLTLTMTTGTSSLQTAAVGNTIWFFGVETDTNVFDGLAHSRHTLAASGRTIMGTQGDYLTSFRQQEPILLVIDNVTAATTLERVTAGYTTKAARRSGKWPNNTAVPSLIPAPY